jgi:beta-N-acetylhexosaminidase
MRSHGHRDGQGPLRGRLAVVAGALTLVVGGGVPILGMGPAVAADPPEAAACAAAVVSSMTLEQQVGQLFVAGVNATGPTADQLALVTSRHLGGVILAGRSSAGVVATRGMTDALRARSGGAVTNGVALWVSTDQEGGNVQVLSGPGFSVIPTALAQGTLAPATLRADAAGWAAQLRAAGVDLDLAPVLDTVPAALGTLNKPIGFYSREFGHDPAAVTASGTAFAAGLADSRVQATAKHFPGLGRVIDNTDTTVGVTDTVTVRGDAYLAPFAAAVRAGIPAVMVSSAVYSRIDPTHIAAYSPIVLGSMLRGDLGFGGVIISDSLGAAALSTTPVADRAVHFLEAGGTAALSAEFALVAPMIDGVLARARTDPAFLALVGAAARRVVATKFADGLVTCPGSTGPIAQHYAALGGAGSFLGTPLGAQRPVAGGAVQSYQHGAIYWSARTGAHEVHGAVLPHYLALGGPEGFLGFPVTDEAATPGAAGRFNSFGGGAGGSIYWSPDTGAHAVNGAILGHYAALGGPAGLLGFPLTDETGSPDRIGRFNHFTAHGAGGSLYWTPATGTHEVHGAIQARWASLGWELGPLGYPISDEYAAPDGRRRNDFQHGSLIWPFA